MAADERLRDAQPLASHYLSGRPRRIRRYGLGGARMDRIAERVELNEHEHGAVRQSCGAEMPLTGIIDACARRAIRAICPWRDQVAAVGLDTISKLLKTPGMKLSGHCRGGMFPAADAQGLRCGARRHPPRRG